MIDTPDTHIVSWSEVHRDTKSLARKLLPLGPWFGIVAVARGGLIPAAILAREMDIRVVDTLCIATYEEREKGAEPRLLKLAEKAIENRGEGWLVVDDLVDTGTTFRAARPLLPKAHFATVYAKPDGIDVVDTFLHQVPQASWVYFPWDTDTLYTEPLVKRGG